MIHTLRYRGWPAPAAASALPHPPEAAQGISVTDRAVLREGTPIVPVSGEIHFSRLPRERWSERLRQMRASGMTLASAYVLWLHHSPAHGVAHFDGALDVGAFIDECAAAGLGVVLRIGPWAHGEARNGGFPDWVQQADVVHRSDDPGYLELVGEWFGQLAAALDGRAEPGGPVLAIQLENELYDRPEHLVTLKRLAREAGMSAPLWTATAWGGAQLPLDEVMPLFGGYGDGFWADPADDWDPSFRAHYFPSHEWDDPGVGADVRATQGFDAAATASCAGSLGGFPPATCELGGGMATAYHRRPVLDGRDIAALAQVKIGNGSAWQGYYMYVGGRNPGPGMQETQDTGYPNDMTEWSYDFHAPIGQSGDLHESATLLRAQHAFLAAFGDRLGGMTSSLPDERPQDLDDTTTLRWALRSDGAEGFCVITHHQPHVAVETVRDVQLRIELPGETLLVPSRPVDIPPGTLARWPIGLRVGDARLRWATGSALTLLPGGILVLAADAGIPVEVAAGDEPPVIVEPGVHEIGGMTLLVLDSADDAWVLGEQLWRCDGELLWDGGRIEVRDATRLHRFDPASRDWADVPVAPVLAPSVAVTTRLVRPGSAVPADYGFGGARHRAPSAEAFDEHAAVFAVEVPGWTGDAVLDIDWAGDAAQLRIDGETVDDRFWDGTRWSVALRDLGARPGSGITLHVLGLSAESTVWLPARARDRLDATDGMLLAVDAVRLRQRASTPVAG
ncbi:beta-galactosidase [Microbacterium sp. YJN-G]|uniref:beta-galactosidase n=1 Tax=Microbacterium sp. YJN-G TaxID=2763257 RepID=UPI0018780607|nr:beta-galactosidase [Microbacterium sp. YJN-G]